MEKSNNSSGDEEYYSCELPNLELKFFARPPPKRFANLSEQELNQLVEQRHSAHGDGPKNNKLVFINLSRLVMHCSNFRENFLAIHDNGLQQKLSL